MVFGIWMNSREEIESELCNHLKGIMTSVGRKGQGLVNNPICPVISLDQNIKLVAIPLDKEIKDVVFNLGSLKSPSPNGYPAKFY